MITWKINSTNYNTVDKFITTAHWSCNGTDGEFATNVYASCSFPTTDPTIPYADVTEQDVLGWIWANGVDKDATEAAVMAKLEALKNPTTASGTPWVVT